MGILLLIILLIVIGITYINKDRFAVITGNINLNNGEGSVSVDYPNGFNIDNCVPISAGFNFVRDANWLGFGFVQNTFGIGVRLSDTKVTFQVYNTLGGSGGVTASKPYKIVLMKIN